MQETTARKLKQKTVTGIFMLAVMLFLLTGCGTSSVFDGSRISNASELRMEYSVLDREETASGIGIKGRRSSPGYSVTFERICGCDRAAGRKRADLPGERAAECRFYSGNHRSRELSHFRFGSSGEGKCFLHPNSGRAGMKQEKSMAEQLIVCG